MFDRSNLHALLLFALGRGRLDRDRLAVSGACGLDAVAEALADEAREPAFARFLAARRALEFDAETTGKGSPPPEEIDGETLADSDFRKSQIENRESQGDPHLIAARQAIQRGWVTPAQVVRGQEIARANRRRKGREFDLFFILEKKGWISSWEANRLVAGGESTGPPARFLGPFWIWDPPAGRRNRLRKALHVHMEKCFFLRPVPWAHRTVGGKELLLRILEADAPGLVAPYHLEVFDGVYHLVTSAPEGRFLGAGGIDSLRVDPEGAAGLLESIAGTLDALAAQGLTARFLDPDSLLYTDAGDLLLFPDPEMFELAGGPAPDRLFLREPESLEAADVDPRAPVACCRSLACIGYRMLARRTPLAGTDPAERLVSVLTGRTAPLAMLPGGIPCQADEAFSQALGPDAPVEPGLGHRLAGAIRASSAVRGEDARPGLRRRLGRILGALGVLRRLFDGKRDR